MFFLTDTWKIFEKMLDMYINYEIDTSYMNVRLFSHHLSTVLTKRLYLASFIYWSGCTKTLPYCTSTVPSACSVIIQQILASEIIELSFDSSCRFISRSDT